MKHLTLKDMNKLSAIKVDFSNKPVSQRNEHIHKLEHGFLFSPGQGMLNAHAYKVCFECGEVKQISIEPEMRVEIDKIIQKR